ncbi:ferritin-like domain-containing protein [Mesorhizobium sp. M0802]|uniref:ferritin-like domain-containing protein n=1 Tax=Mesorhizobium sp. M0802 TaxID=2957001 RepID=UPI0033373C73
MKRPVLRWHRPAARTYDGISQEGLQNLPPLQQQRALLETVGVPLVADAKTAKDQAIGLLKVAAEVEHALLVQYLYAADSILDGEGPPSYAKMLRNIAIQEMGHLATVQNLLLLLGGPAALHMQRDVLRKLSEYNPIPFVLEPVRLESLAKYTVAEQPAKVSDGLEALVSRLQKIAATDAGIEPNRVGAIYAMVRWFLLDEDEATAWMDLTAMVDLPGNTHVTDQDLQPSDVVLAHQATSTEWGDHFDSFLLETATTRETAVKAIDVITEQGEGFNTSDESDTHFEQFIKLVTALEAGSISVKAIATSPTLAPGQGGEKPQAILNSYTRLWAGVQSLQYTLVALSILHAMSLSRDVAGDAELREALARRAVRVGMRETLQPLSDILTAQPIDIPGGVLAGSCYDLDTSLLESADTFTLAERHLDILARLENLYGQVEASPEFVKPENKDHGTVLKDLRKTDQKHKKLFDFLPSGPGIG